MNLYLFIKVKKGGALVHVYVWEHIVSPNYRITYWIFTKLDRDKVLMTPHICIDYWGKSTKGRIHGRAILCQWGVPSSKNFFFRLEEYSNECIAII